jgi:ribosomal-protein-alanine acetyltransferase
MNDDLPAVCAIQSRCPAAAQWHKDDYLRLASDPCGMILVAEVEALTQISHSAESLSSGQRKGGASAPLSERSRFAFPSHGREQSGPDGSEVVGFAAFHRVIEEAELRNLAVEPAHQRQGAARSLLRQGIHKLQESGARRIFLEVRASNHPALALYGSLGLRLHSTRKGYYQDPLEDATVMVLDIPSPP